MFADRFTIDIKFVMTQHVDPNIEKETDPNKILQMFTTELEILGRITVTKSLGFLKGRVISESEKQTTKCYEMPMANVHETL